MSYFDGNIKETTLENGFSQNLGFKVKYFYKKLARTSQNKKKGKVAQQLDKDIFIIKFVFLYGLLKVA